MKKDEQEKSQRAIWTRADLRGVNFAGVSLEGADLRATDLRGANFTGSNLRYADLPGGFHPGNDLRQRQSVRRQDAGRGSRSGGFSRGGPAAGKFRRGLSEWRDHAASRTRHLVKPAGFTVGRGGATRARPGQEQRPGSRFFALTKGALRWRN